MPIHYLRLHSGWHVPHRGYERLLVGSAMTENSASPTPQTISDGSLGVPSVLLESDLPQSHIEELHLRIDEVADPHSAPRFLEAVVVGLVKIRELAHRLQAVFRRCHLVCRNAILKESVVRGHAPERSHQDFRDEDR